MKKIILGLVSLLALTTSCSKHEIETYSAERQIVEEYNAAFKQYVGGEIHPDQSWGFDQDFSNISKTRTVVKADMTDYPSATAPAAVTQKEAEWVTNWFRNNPGLTEEGQPFTNFYVQFVSGDQTNKKGIWHRHDQNPQPNGRDWDEEFTDNGGMDKLHCGATRSQGATDHLNDFNAKTGGPWDVVYIKNGSALQWGYHSSWGEDSKAPAGDGYYWYFKMVELTVPGSCFSDGVARKGWYVGLSLYGKKYDNGDKELGYQRLEYAEDWIVKVVPGESETKKYTIRIIAEDLTFGQDKDTDFDFNDVVFDVAIMSNGETWVKLQAAGGTLPLFIENFEVHDMFGVNRDVMVNTKSSIHGATKEPREFKLAKTYTNAKSIPIYVQKNGTRILLKAEKGEPASKVGVPVTFKWCDERVSIKGSYPLFSDWATKHPELLWW